MPPLAGVAVNVITPPEQMVAVLDLITTEAGAVLHVVTVIGSVAVFEQLFASVPVTVYVNETVGAKACPFTTPPDQEYVFAPTPLKVTLEPLQILTDGDALATTIGNEFTVIVLTEELEHDFESVPVTVYVLVIVGVSAKAAVDGPLVQTYVEAPVPVRVTLEPAQIADEGKTSIPTFGNAFTTTFAVPDPVPEQLASETETIEYVPAVETGMVILELAEGEEELNVFVPSL